MASGKLNTIKCELRKLFVPTHSLQPHSMCLSAPFQLKPNAHTAQHTQKERRPPHTTAHLAVPSAFTSTTSANKPQTYIREHAAQSRECVQKNCRPSVDDSTTTAYTASSSNHTHDTTNALIWYSCGYYDDDDEGVVGDGQHIQKRAQLFASCSQVIFRRTMRETFSELWRHTDQIEP